MKSYSPRNKSISPTLRGWRIEKYETVDFRELFNPPILIPIFVFIILPLVSMMTLLFTISQFYGGMAFVLFSYLVVAGSIQVTKKMTRIEGRLVKVSND